MKNAVMAASILVLVLGVLVIPVTSDWHPCFCLKPLHDELSTPVAMQTFHEYGHQRMAVAQQAGVVTALSMEGQLLRTMLDITRQVITSNDFGDPRGLLGFALDPDFNETGHMYTFYRRRAEDGGEETVLSRFTSIQGAGHPETELVLLRVPQTRLHGNGGPLLFDGEGMLYLAVGDGDATAGPGHPSQDLSSLKGKILRLAVGKAREAMEGMKRKSDQPFADSPYAVPIDNPYISVPDARAEIWALGLRNPWGCSWDTTHLGGTGAIYCAETGTQYQDEINVIKKGRNYGWPIKEGTACVNESYCPHIADEAPPMYAFPHTSRHALVGGLLYRGRAHPNNFDIYKRRHFYPGNFFERDNYVFGDVISGSIYLLPHSTAGEDNREEWQTHNETYDLHEWKACPAPRCPAHARAPPRAYLTAFAADDEGEIYVGMSHGLLSQQAAAAVMKIVPGLPQGTCSTILASKLVTSFGVVLSIVWKFA